MLRMHAKEEAKWWCCISSPDALLLDLVRTAEHAVDAGEVVCAREDGLGASLGGVILLQVSLLTEVAHLQNLSAT